MKWLYGIIDAMDMNLGKLQEMVRDREAWRAGVLEIHLKNCEERGGLRTLKQKVGWELKLGDRCMGIQQIILLTCVFENCCNDRKERKRQREGGKERWEAKNK